MAHGTKDIKIVKTNPLPYLRSALIRKGESAMIYQPKPSPRGQAAGKSDLHFAPPYPQDTPLDGRK